MLNASGTVPLSQTLFNGLNTELSPTDLPSGLSPDCSDVAFLPGAVFTRPPFRRLTTLGTIAQIVYTHSFPKGDGTIVKMDFDSFGGIWANGVKISSTAPGNRFYATNANGRTYIAISDGTLGADVPLQYDGTYLDRVSQDGPGAPPVVNNLATPTSMVQSLTRVKGVVSAVTQASHGLIAGNRFLLTGVNTLSVGGGVSSIVIDTLNAPSVATITTNSPHGLVPEDVVLLNNVANVVVGGTMTNSVVKSDIQTITTSQPHGLQVGAQIYLHYNFDSVNMYPETVQTVPSPTTFTFATTGADAGDTEGGLVYLRFPQLDPTNGDAYTVSETPTPTTFQVPINYVNGTWTSGTITFAWNDTFYVSAVQSPTAFTYAQAGPDASSGTVGTITPQGQIAPGTRGCICMFQTRTGFISGPSPKVQFTGNGGQQIVLTEIPIGPANVTARIIGFTLEQGARWFYIPITPLDPSGLFPIGTSTVINDNTTTTATFDFADETLEAGIALDVPGNNVFQQQVLGPCLGFHAYEGRLIAWGERNKIQQFINMSFDGGYVADQPTLPLGWALDVNTNVGALTPTADYGLGWKITGSGSGTDGGLHQTAYEDEDGVAITQPNTQYTFRCWASGTGGFACANLFSASAGELGHAFAPVTGTGFVEMQFTSKTPAVIPADTQLFIFSRGLAQGQTLVLDECELYYTANPILLTAKASYEDNFEAFDGITGVFGPANDPNPIRGMVGLDGILSVLTTGPMGAHYRVEDSSSGEPATWTVRKRGEKCGLTSVWGIASFENWFCWASDTGLRIFEGGNVDKISQEVQTLWNSINPLAKQFTVLANDPYIRRVYILVATGYATYTNATWVLDYRELNSAAALSGSGTLHITQLGKVSTSDLTRKWTIWSVPFNYCGLIAQANGAAVMAFCGGAGGGLTSPAKSTVYTLLESDLSGIDDDYGPFWDTSYYTTSFVPEVEGAAQLQLKPYRMLYTFLTANLQGNGAVYFTPLLGGLDSSGRVTRPVNVSLGLARDRGYGLNEATERLALQIRVQPQGPQPAPATAPAGFFLSSLVLSVTQHPFSEVSGWNR